MCDRCAELEERVEELERIVQHFDVRPEDEDASPGLEDLYFADMPIGKILENAVERSKENRDRLETDDAANGAVSPEVRSALLEVHANWIDIREGRTQQFQSRANERRATHLFARFLEKMRSEASETGVIASQDQLTMSGDRAAEIIRAEDEMPKSGVSKTVRRSFREVVRGSNPHDCQCDWTECNHGLFAFKKTADGYQLRVREADWRQYCEEVTTLIEGVEDATATDDGADAPEDQLADDWSRLDAAEVNADD